MASWISYLKRDRSVLIYIILFTILLTFLLIFTPYYDKEIYGILSIIISLLVSILTAVIIVYFTFYKNQYFERVEFFKALHNEILKNKGKLEDSFKDDCDELQSKWIKGDYPSWLDKQPQTGNISIFFWRYMYLDAYPILISRGYHIEIEGLKNNNLFTTLGNYYSLSNKFCDDIQVLELNGNVFAGILDKMNHFKIDSISDFVYMYDLKHSFVPINSTRIYQRHECENEIKNIINKMKNEHYKFLPLFSNMISSISLSQSDFINSILRPIHHEKPIYLKIFPSNCLYYTIISSITIIFLIYSLLKVKGKLFTDIMFLTHNYWVWVIGFTIIFIVLAFLWIENTKNDCYSH